MKFRRGTWAPPLTGPRLSLEPSEDFDPLGTLEKIDQVVVAINFLDSVVRLPERVYLDISVARLIIENLSKQSP